MTCGGCERRVHDAVTALPGVRTVMPEHIGDEVEVTFDPAALDVEGDLRERSPPPAIARRRDRPATMGARRSRYATAFTNT